MISNLRRALGLDRHLHGVSDGAQLAPVIQSNLVNQPAVF
jgi:hypothetical protein